ETGKRYVFLTNNFKLSAKTIADIYKARWQVELFFKWIKQNLKIKSFVGTSKNAVMTQIWIALCIYLLLAFLKFQSKLQKSTQQILRLLQLNLFEKRDLMALLRGDPPCDNQPDINQMVLL
ncbi:transposase, partial [Sulfuriflexus sp.]|uniref:transposase n=1 Tax=Sulfuriflexus sp. TaxID=2015443 RepID=UPI0028CEECAE